LILLLASCCFIYCSDVIIAVVRIPKKGEEYRRGKKMNEEDENR
jgi:hypothetical protein